MLWQGRGQRRRHVCKTMHVPLRRIFPLTNSNRLAMVNSWLCPDCCHVNSVFIWSRKLWHTATFCFCSECTDARAPPSISRRCVLVLNNCRHAWTETYPNVHRVRLWEMMEGARLTGLRFLCVNSFNNVRQTCHDSHEVLIIRYDSQQVRYFFPYQTCIFGQFQGAGRGVQKVEAGITFQRRFHGEHYTAGSSSSKSMSCVLITELPIACRRWNLPSRLVLREPRAPPLPSCQRLPADENPSERLMKSTRLASFQLANVRRINVGFGTPVTVYVQSRRSRLRASVRSNKWSRTGHPHPRPNTTQRKPRVVSYIIYPALTRLCFLPRDCM